MPATLLINTLPPVNDSDERLLVTRFYARLNPDPALSRNGLTVAQAIVAQVGQHLMELTRVKLGSNVSTIKR